MIEAGGGTLLETTSQTLTLLSPSRSDAANYTCRGNNSFSSESSQPHWLEIFYGPDPPIINPLQQIYNERSTLNLSCFALSNPPAKYSWYLNGEFLEHQNTSHLVQQLSLNNAGNYTCNVTNEETGLFSHTVLEISILEAVTNITIHDSGKVLEDSTARLTCMASGFNVSYYWLKGDRGLEAGEHISFSSNGQILTLDPATRNDSGNYTCYGNNSFSSNVTSYFLNVLYGPDDPVISPSEQFYAEGSSVTLSCKAESYPPANYTWSFNGSLHDGGTLPLLKLAYNNSGNYTCEASNAETNISRFKSQVIFVEEELLTPVLSTEEYFWREEYFVPEKANATLRCNTFSSPRITISWFQDGGPLPEAQLSDQNRTLTLLSLTRNDTRRYTCVVSNHIRNVTSNAVTITVSYGPEAAMLNQPESVIKPLGSTLVLLCNTSDSVPKPKLQWWFNNTLQAEMNDTFHDTFHVQLKAWEDEGNYTCQAVNPITHAVVQAFVYVKLEDDPGGISVGTIVGIVLGSVAGLVLSVGIGYFLCTKATCGRMEQHTTNGNMSSTPGRNEATDGKSITAEEDIQYSTLAIKINNSAQPASGFAQPLENSTVYSEIKKT